MKEPRAVLHDDEREDFEASERGDWAPSEGSDGDPRFRERIARSGLAGKRRRVSIAIPERDLARLKTRAAEKGMPYQTLINSILHEYVVDPKR